MSEENTVESTELPPQEERDFVVAEDLQQEARPEWLPEKFKTPEDLAKSYNELSTKLGAKEEDLRNKFIEELNQEAYKDRPASAGEYQLPESFEEGSITDSDIVQWWANHAYDNGFSQDEFADGLNKIMAAASADIPDIDEEFKKLGDNASARVEAAALFSNKFFPQEHIPSIERLTETADGLMALEFIMDQLKSPRVNADSTPVDQITIDSLQSMMQDERYWNPARRDMNYVKQVDEGFQKLQR
jgi:hypothetical protein